MIQSLRTVRVGLLLGLLAILAGFVMGGLFGAREDAIKDGLWERASAVLDSAYGGDEAAARKVADKSWSYHKRAHMHWGGIGAVTVALSLLLGLVGGAAGPRALLSLLLGAGALTYPLAWLLAGRSAPGLGSTGAAKEALDLWFVLPAGLLLLGSLGTLAFAAQRLFVARDDAA